jgi:hypothetical protein
VRRCEWVVDTWVLKVAADSSHDLALDALALLREILEHHSIALDHEDHIWCQYRDNIPRNSHVQKWWASMVSRGRTARHSGKVDQRPKTHLLENLRFHDDDLPFVAVASKAKNRLLVAQESDYTDEVVQYLWFELHVKVVGIREALEIARDP